MTTSKLKIWVLAFGALTTTAPAYAYLDPGTGSMLIQGVIGAIAAAGVTVKIFWHKLRVLFGGKSTVEDDSDRKDSST